MGLKPDNIVPNQKKRSSLIVKTKHVDIHTIKTSEKESKNEVYNSFKNDVHTSLME